MLEQRHLDVQFNLGANTSSGAQKQFVEGGNQVYLKGLRTSARIIKAGGASMGTADISVFGMTPSTMNQLSTIGINPLVIGPNFVTVLAYSGDATPSVIFQGSITSAWFDGGGMPDVPFRVVAHSGLYQAIAPAPPSSYPGAVSASQVLQSLASQMNLAFENTGVQTMLPEGTYFHGSARNQALACAKAANINMLIDPPKLAIWPKGKARGSSVPEDSVKTGMKGYPAYMSKGIEVVTLFNPDIGFGSNIKVVSSLKPACGTWNVFGLDHNLEAQVPGGSWFSTIRAAPLGGSVTTPGVQSALG